MELWKPGKALQTPCPSPLCNCGWRSNPLKVMRGTPFRLMVEQIEFTHDLTNSGSDQSNNYTIFHLNEGFCSTFNELTLRQEEEREEL
jgi:hypothetical protein